MPKFTSKADFSNIDDFIRNGKEDIRALMAAEGERFVESAKETGDYRDRTGNLRKSNFYRVDGDTLVLGNSAPYASAVEARGFRVCSDEALDTERRLKEAMS